MSASSLPAITFALFDTSSICRTNVQIVSLCRVYSLQSYKHPFCSQTRARLVHFVATPALARRCLAYVTAVDVSFTCSFCRPHTWNSSWCPVVGQVASCFYSGGPSWCFDLFPYRPCTRMQMQLDREDCTSSHETGT